MYAIVTPSFTGVGYNCTSIKKRRVLRGMNSIQDDVELLTHLPDNVASDTGREI